MGKPKTQLCSQCGLNKRLKEFRLGENVCKACSGKARHPDRGIKPTKGGLYCKLPFGGHHKRKVTPLPQNPLGSQLMRVVDHDNASYYNRLRRALKSAKDSPIKPTYKETSASGLGYIADHVSSQVGRLITQTRIGSIYKASCGPYDVRALENVHTHYLGRGLYLSTQIKGQMVPSQSGNVKYLGNGWYETEPGGKGVGEPIDNDNYVIEHAHHQAIPGHQRDYVAAEAAFEYAIRKMYPQTTIFPDSYKTWKEEMIKARSIESDSLTTEVLEELESIPVNEQNEQPYLPSDGGIEYDEQSYDRDYYSNRHC